MRMFFMPEETEAFETGLELLCRRYESWARGVGLAADPFVAACALEFRHHGVDGRLGFWTQALVRDFLLEWLPRRVSATAEEMETAPEALGSLLRYLEYAGLLAPGAAPLSELEGAVDAAADEFPGAMADEGRFGVAKFWTMRARDAGVDVTDPAAVQRFAQQAEAEPDLLDRIVARQLEVEHTGQAPPSLPVALPQESVLADAAGTSALVTQVRGLVDWLGTGGRALTQRGNLKLTDARHLVEALDTGDAIDPVIGGRRWRTTSSAELGGLVLIVELAKRVRLVRVVKNRLLPVARNRHLVDDPLALWDRLFGVLGEAADVVLGAESPLGGSVLYLGYTETVQDVLNSLYSMPELMPVLRLEEPIWQRAREDFTIDEAPTHQREIWRMTLHYDLLRVLRALDRLGALELTSGTADPAFCLDLGEDDDSGEDQQVPTVPLPEEARARLRAALAPDAGPVDLARLTTLGTRAVRSRLLAAGRYAPLVGELRDAGPAQLLGTLAEHYTSETAVEELAGWLAARGGQTQAMPRLLEAIRQCPLRTRAAAMLDVLAMHRPDRNEWLHTLRDDAGIGPLAVNSLVNEGACEPDALTAQEQQLGMAEQFIHLLEAGGRESVRQTLETMPNDGQRNAILSAVLDSGHPDTTGLAELRELAGPSSQDTTVHSLVGLREAPSRQGRQRKRRKR